MEFNRVRIRGNRLVTHHGIRDAMSRPIFVSQMTSHFNAIFRKYDTLKRYIDHI